MKNNRYTLLEKIGSILLLIGLLLVIIPISVISFKTDIVFGTIILGIVVAVTGIIILLRE